MKPSLMAHVGFLLFAGLVLIGAWRLTRKQEETPTDRYIRELWEARE